MGLAPPKLAAPKAEWRAWAQAERADLPDRSAELAAHLRELLRDLGAERVLAYHALPGEPSVAALASEFELLTTRARFKPHIHLTIHPWASATEVSRFGVLQPPANAPRVELIRVDAIVLPGLAFDLRGVRLGYGGGFYDRLLPEFNGPTIGVVWAELLVPALPAEAHDCRVEWIATQGGVQKSTKV